VKIWASLAVLGGVVLGAAPGSARAESVAPISGGRPESDPGHFTFQQFDHLEGQLRGDLNGAPDEVFALLSGGYWGDAGQIVVRVQAGKGQLVFMPDRARRFTRPLHADELEPLRAFLTKTRAFKLEALTTDVADGMQYELVHLTKSGGQRVFMNNPDVVDAHPYVDICRRFRALLDKPGLTLSYLAQQTNPDLQVLVSDPAWAVNGVHMDGSQVILQLVKRRARRADSMHFPEQHRLSAALPPSSSDEPIWVSWPSLTPVEGGRLNALSLARIPIPHATSEWLNASGWASEHEGVRYFVADDGLRQVSRQTPDTLVVGGTMANPLVAPDGNTVLVARTDQRSWERGSYFALIDLRKHQVKRVDIATANEMVPIMTTPAGFLVKRGRASREALPADWPFEGPDKPEYFVVAASGAVRKVDGDFAPLPGVLTSPLQPAGAATVWAVKTDWRNGVSTLGRYDLERFAFTPVRELRGLALGTNDIAVDEKVGQVYGLHDGDLVRFKLKPN
jgi:hypothetical protein